MRRFLAASGMAAIFGSVALLGFIVPLSSGRDGLNCALSGSRAFADITDFTDTPANPTLKDMLAKGLKARRPEEFAFVDRVVKMVNHKQLPLDMVQSTFLWARKKPEHQFQYFERGLKLRAQDAGVHL